uniref:Ig-like domain-containing protein n=1 Tax=Falco tinnunculus TaxID=100819 RepID=A0A8C4U0L1_FALTI
MGPWLPGCPCSLSAGVWAQPRLVEAGGGLRPSGGSVQLSCRGSGFQFKGLDVCWYRQAFGGGLEWVSACWSFGAINCGASVEGRATAFRDSSLSELSLSLCALHP